MSGQFEVLRPFITDRVSDLVRSRLLEGLKFFGTTALRPGFNRDEVKLALLLVRIANPDEVLTDAETKLLKAPLRSSRQQKEKGRSPEENGTSSKTNATRHRRKKPSV